MHLCHRVRCDHPTSRAILLAMSMPAAIEQRSAPITPQTDEKPAKTRRVSARIRHAVDLIVSGECRLQKDAAAKAKISPERLSRALKESHVITYLEQQTRVSIARLQAPAAGRLAHLLANAQSEHVQKDIAIHTLSIAGIKPRADAQVSVNIDIKAGYVIDLTDQAKPVTDTRLTQRVIDHE